MARKAAPTDFTLSVDGIGTFAFARRSMNDELKIQVEYARIIEGVVPTIFLEQVGGWIATLRVLTVRAPEDWDIEAMDPLDNDTYARLGRVHAALVAKEASFRAKPASGGESGGEGHGENGGILVPPALSPAAE